MGSGGADTLEYCVQFLLYALFAYVDSDAWILAGCEMRAFVLCAF